LTTAFVGLAVRYFEIGVLVTGRDDGEGTWFGWDGFLGIYNGWQKKVQESRFSQDHSNIFTGEDKNLVAICIFAPQRVRDNLNSGSRKARKGWRKERKVLVDYLI